MADDRDTLVDPQMRREVARPRSDAWRPALLIAIVVTSALAGAAAMALLRGPRSAPTPPSAVPAVTPAIPAVPATPAIAPVAPAVEAPAVLPMSRVGGPCVDYHQKSRGDDDPTGVDCFRGEQ
jgi:hypothetical protein